MKKMLHYQSKFNCQKIADCVKSTKCHANKLPLMKNPRLPRAAAQGLFRHP